MASVPPRYRRFFAPTDPAATLWPSVAVAGAYLAPEYFSRGQDGFTSSNATPPFFWSRSGTRLSIAFFGWRAPGSAENGAADRRSAIGLPVSGAVQDAVGFFLSRREMSRESASCFDSRSR
jgi:hypothetical protein